MPDTNNWPPMQYPQAPNDQVVWPAQDPPPTGTVQTPPPAATENVNWTAATPEPNTSTRVEPYVTQAAINSFFNIVSPRPGSGT